MSLRALIASPDSLLQCQKTYSRKEFVVRHLRTKKDDQHEGLRRRLNDSVALAAAALPRTAALPPLKESPSTQGSAGSNDGATAGDSLSASTSPMAPTPERPTADSGQADACAPGDAPQSLLPPVDAIRAAQSPESTSTQDPPLLPTLASLSAPFANLSPLPSRPLPIPPPVLPSTVADELVPPSEWGGIDVLEGLLCDPLLDPGSSATPFTAHWEGSASVESPSNLAVLVLPGSPREWEEAEDEGEEGPPIDVVASDPSYWTEPSFYPDQ